MTEETKENSLIIMPKQRKIYKPGWYEELSNDEYHGSHGYSSSTLKKFTEKTFAHIQYEMDHPPQQSDAMALGTAVHSLAMEPNKFSEEFAVKPLGLKKPTAAQYKAKKHTDKTIAQIQAWAEWEASTEGKIILSYEDFEKATEMARKLHEHPQAGLYLREGVPEQSIYYWYNPEDWDDKNDYRIMCKIRPDWIIKGHSVLFDLKTTRNGSHGGFMKSVKDLGYHISAAMYLDGANRCEEFLDFAEVTGFLNFVWICVENFAPYEVSCYELSDKDREAGEDIYHNCIRKLHQYKMSNWKGYGDFDGENVQPITRLSAIPTWPNKIV